MNRDWMAVAVVSFLALVVFLCVVFDFVWGGHSHRGGDQ